MCVCVCVCVCPTDHAVINGHNRLDFRRENWESNVCVCECVCVGGGRGVHVGVEVNLQVLDTLQSLCMGGFFLVLPSSLFL